MDKVFKHIASEDGCWHSGDKEIQLGKEGLCML